MSKRKKSYASSGSDDELAEINGPGDYNPSGQPRRDGRQAPMLGGQGGAAAADGPRKLRAEVPEHLQRRRAELARERAALVPAGGGAAAAGSVQDAVLAPRAQARIAELDAAMAELDAAMAALSTDKQQSKRHKILGLRF